MGGTFQGTAFTPPPSFNVRLNALDARKTPRHLHRAPHPHALPLQRPAVRAGLAPGLAPPPPNFAARLLINSYRATSPPRKPRSPVQQHEAGLEAYVKGDLGESVARLNLAVWMSGPEQRAPRTLAAQQLQSDRAHALLKKRRPHDALKDVSRVLAFGPTAPELYDTRAHANRLLGEAGRAAADERAAASLRPPPRPPPPARVAPLTAPAAGARAATLPPHMGRRYAGTAPPSALSARP
jgi:hypothetical protein